MKSMFMLATALTFSQLSLASVPCQDQDFVLMKSPVVIQTAGHSYSPRCAKVKAGTQITIQASSMHPLAPMAPFNATVNPFANGSFNSDQTRTATSKGVFGFFCTNHGDVSGNGMAGMVTVE